MYLVMPGSPHDEDTEGDGEEGEENGAVGRHVAGQRCRPRYSLQVQHLYTRQSCKSWRSHKETVHLSRKIITQ